MKPADLEPYLPEPGWFRHNPGGIHGVGHVTRVLVWTARIVEDLVMPGAIRCEELLWAAACHDVGRVDDGKDPGHGTRSASWVATELVRRRPRTRDLDLDFVQELCGWHEVPDHRIERMSIELLILKDADGLDRVRIYRPRPGAASLAGVAAVGTGCQGT